MVRLFFVAMMLSGLAGCASNFDNGYAADLQGRYSEAAQYYQAAANQGEPAAFNNLGRLYQYGLGVPENVPLAIQYFNLAARYGIASAQQNLIKLGQPVPAADLAPSNVVVHDPAAEFAAGQALGQAIGNAIARPH